MDLGVVLEVAIGIIFVWIVFSLTVSQIQEWINSMLDKRAKDMEFAIQEMLANPNLKAQLYDHPVIRGLTAKKRKKPSRIPNWFYKYPLLRGFTKEKRKLPSYIPAQQFARALFDITMTADTESSLIQQGILRLRDDLKNDSRMPVHKAIIDELNLLAELARSAAATEAGTAITNKTLALLRKETEEFIQKFKEKNPTINIDERVISSISTSLDKTLKEAVRLKGDMAGIVSQQPGGGSDAGLVKLRRGVAALSVISPEVNQTLNALLMNVEEYAADKEKLLAQARENVEHWFNDTMDRTSGVFKRYSQNMALVIGIIVALLLNVDSITLTTYLWRQPSVREALVAQSSTFQLDEQQLQTNPQQAMAEFTRQFTGINLPVGWAIIEDPASQGITCQLFPKNNEAASATGENTETLTFGIPVPGNNICIAPAQPNNESTAWTKLAGILITAFAARLGAPFWFEALKKVVNLRSTGPNPAEKPAK